MTATITGGAIIRSATHADLAAVHALLEASALPRAGVEGSLDGFFVGEADGELVGVVGLEACCDRYALLRSTAVAETWRSRGLGRRLVERALAEAEARGYQALYLLTTTAEHYFPSFGFAKIDRAEVPPEVQRTDEFRGACPASATAMMRRMPDK